MATRKKAPSKPQPVTMCPAPGWWAAWKDGQVSPILCWMHEDGAVFGMITDEQGNVEPADSFPEFVSYVVGMDRGEALSEAAGLDFTDEEDDENG